LNVLSSYLETKYKGLSWENYVSICTGGAPSVVGSITDFACLDKRKRKILTLPQHTASMLSRYFSSHEPVGQISARP
jgi:hypothetical protein